LSDGVAAITGIDRARAKKRLKRIGGVCGTHKNIDKNGVIVAMDRQLGERTCGVLGALKASAV
jgi:hypothetical protein